MKHYLISKSFIPILLSVVFFVVFSPKHIYADGVQLSTTQVGSIATFTSQLPADPCGVHKLGETKTRTVVGFIIATTPFEMGDDKVMRIVNERRADLTDATIWNITIAGQQITDFVEDPDTLKVTNLKDFIHSHRTFKLNSPIEYSPLDTASIMVTNVKISAKGKIQAWFGLQEPTGIYCLSSMQSIITIGDVAPTGVPFQGKNTIVPTKIQTKLTPTLVISPTHIKTDPSAQKIQINTKSENTSILDNILEFIKKIFGVNSK